MTTLNNFAEHNLADITDKNTLEQVLSDPWAVHNFCMLLLHQALIYT